MKIIQQFTALFILVSLFAQDSLGQNWFTSGIKGEGPKVTKTLNVPAFEGIALSINAELYLKQGSSQSVKIEAQQNIIDNILTGVEKGTWKIRFDKNVRGHELVKIWVTVPALNQVSISGSGDVIGESSFSSLKNLSLAVSGSGTIKLDANSQAADVAISGSGKMKLSGQTGDCSIRISGSGNVEAFELKMATCSVRISGSGDAAVNVQEDLNVSISGSGDVFYKGSARVKSKISGSGDVISK